MLPPPPPTSTLFPYTTLFRSRRPFAPPGSLCGLDRVLHARGPLQGERGGHAPVPPARGLDHAPAAPLWPALVDPGPRHEGAVRSDRARGHGRELDRRGEDQQGIRTRSSAV